MKRKISSDELPSSNKRQKDVKSEIEQGRSKSGCETPEGNSGNRNSNSTSSKDPPSGKSSLPRLESVVPKLEDTYHKSGKRNSTSSKHSSSGESSLPEPESAARKLENTYHKSRKRNHTTLEEDEAEFPEPLALEAKPHVFTNPKSSPEAGKREKKAAIGRFQIGQLALTPPPTPESEEKDHSTSEDGGTTEPIAKKTKHRHSSAAQHDFPDLYTQRQILKSKTGLKSSLDKLPREIRNMIYSEVLGTNRRRTVFLQVEAQLQLEEQKPANELRDHTITRIKRQMEQESGEGYYYQPIRMLDTAIFRTSTTVYKEARSAFLESNNVHVLPGLQYYSYLVPEPVAFDSITEYQLLEARKMELVCNTAMLPLIAEVLAQRENQPQELHIRLCKVAETTSCFDFISWIRSLVGVRAKACTLQICKIEAYQESHTASIAVPIDDLCDGFKVHIDDIVGIIESRLRIDVEEVRLTTTAI
ncbi:hypothetical protein BLS_001501 [Venturia inaequalis]|uniref:Uncharacterized protein n=1 Tax=Venturia inaequalis TaxID=5025 RepID=A0A8H3UXL2_VENIN|nr:hypothetical protein BLS_001501 [Venturia inaequalis]